MARLRIETAPEITVYDEAFVIKAAANATAPLIQLKNSSGTVVGNISSNGTLNVASVIASNAGTSSTDLATRAYVDSLAAGTNWHAAVAWGTNAALPACTYNNGTDGVGATLTGNAFGALVVDGATVEQDESLLIKDQVDAKQNGIYTITNTGGASAYFVLTRRTDADNSPAGEVKPGDAVYVVNGAATAGNSYVVTSAGTGAGGQISIGVDNIVYSIFAGTAATQAGTGLTRTGYIINVISADAGRIVVNQDSIDLATVNVSSSGGSNTTTFVDSITTDSYGRVTGTRTSSVDFTGFAFSANSVLTGTPTAPTAPNASTSTTQIATTEFVQARALIAESNAANSAGNIFIQKSIFDAKGDIIVGAADDTFSKLSVGTNGYFLRANSSAGVGIEWASVPIINNLDDVGDVTITGNATGQYLRYNGSAWINESIAPLNSIDDISGVTLTDVASGNFLKYNGSAWINDLIDLGTDTTGNYVSDVTAGTGITISHTQGEGSSANVSIANTAVTEGSYTYPSITVNAQGQLTAASNGTAPVTSVTGGTGVTISGTTTPTISIGQSVATNANVSFGTISTDGNVTVGGNLIVTGTTTTVNQTSLNISDPLIYLNGGSEVTDPDLGFAGNYNDGTYRHAGLFSDASDSHKFKFFKGLTVEPTAPINTAHGSYAAADVVANTFESTVATGTAPFIVASNTVVTNLNADLLDGQSSAYYAPIDNPTFTGTVTLPANTVTSAMIAEGTIVDADISTTAAIDQSKIADTVLNQQTASYTLVLTDKNKMVEISNASATTLTIPADNSVNFATGATIVILQTNTGQITLTAGSGVTLNATPGAKLRTQWSSATLVKRAANTWVALGDLSA